MKPDDPQDGRESRIPFLSAMARRKKIAYFFRDVPKTSRILEIGCGDHWLAGALARAGWTDYTGLDITPPADIIGDIRDWRRLGLAPASFDIIVAFEVVEHVPCYQEMFDLLRSGGYLFLTSPKPNWDWLCRILEDLGLTQKRSSPHDFLIDFGKVPLLKPLSIRSVGLAAQWGRFQKPG